jgi:hypothetical protein
MVAIVASSLGRKLVAWCRLRLVIRGTCTTSTYFFSMSGKGLRASDVGYELAILQPV